MADAHLAKLLALLAGHENKSFDELSAAFQTTFEKGTDQYVAACEAAMLLHGGGSNSVNAAQRLSALHILFGLYPIETLKDKKNPFMGVIVDLLDDSSAAGPAERGYIAAWLRLPPASPTPLSPELLRSTPLQILEVSSPTTSTSASTADNGSDSDKAVSRPLPPPSAAVVEALKMEYSPPSPSSIFTSISPLHRLGVNPLVTDHNVSRIRDEIDEDPRGRGAIERKKEMEAAAGDNGSGTGRSVGDLLHSFEPQFVRMPPPVMELREHEEMTWLNPPLPIQPIWDHTMCDDAGPGGELRELMRHALKTALTQQQQARVLQLLEETPSLAAECGVTPRRLPELAETNPMVALKVLLTMEAVKSPHVTEYYSTLVSMPMSLHSMEVVNRLTTAVELPPEFVHGFLSNCIAQATSTTDKYTQNRLVRLVCVFLLALIRNKSLNPEDIQSEVLTFCMEFSRVKEAANLYKMLRSGSGSATADQG